MVEFLCPSILGILFHVTEGCVLLGSLSGLGISEGFSGFSVGGGVRLGFWGDIFGWIGFRELK